MDYIWQHKEWPKLLLAEPSQASIDLEAEATRVAARLAGFTHGLSETSAQTAGARMIADEGVDTSAIEGVQLSRDSFFASALRRAGVSTSRQIDRRHAPLIDALIDAAGNPSDPITEDTLHRWHKAVMATHNNPFDAPLTGHFRTADDDMQIVSRRQGRHDTVHFTAPASDAMDDEVSKLLAWIRGLGKPSLRDAALAHLWFETIHPYEDGNGRTGRLLWDRMVAKAIAGQQMRPGRWWALSHHIVRDKKSYYDALNDAQTGRIAPDEFAQWGLRAIKESLEKAFAVGHEVVRAQEIMASAAQADLNPRQREVLSMLVKHGAEAFAQGMTTKRYCKKAVCSEPTASRDLASLVRQGFLRPEGEGRGRRYHVRWGIPDIESAGLSSNTSDRSQPGVLHGEEEDTFGL